MTPLRFILSCLGTALCALVILGWNRRTPARRFRRAFGTAARADWPEAAAPFLAALAEAFRLPPAWMRALPPEATPMALYLTLYPAHCIYDESEMVRFERALRERLGVLPEGALTCPLNVLAKHWQVGAEPKKQNGDL